MKNAGGWRRRGGTSAGRILAYAAERPGFLAALEPLIGSVTDEQMRRANKAVDLDGRTPAEAARQLLSDLPAPDLE